MNIALIAHDAKKELMTQFCIAYCGILSRHSLCATGTTGKIVSEATGLHIVKYLSGSQGGDQQIGARIACNEIDLLLLFRDGVEPLVVLVLNEFLGGGVGTDLPGRPRVIDHTPSGKGLRGGKEEHGSSHGIALLSSAAYFVGCHSEFSHSGMIFCCLFTLTAKSRYFLIPSVLRSSSIFVMAVWMSP